MAQDGVGRHAGHSAGHSTWDHSARRSALAGQPIRPGLHGQYTSTRWTVRSYLVTAGWGFEAPRQLQTCRPEATSCHSWQHQGGVVIPPLVHRVRHEVPTPGGRCRTPHRADDERLSRGQRAAGAPDPVHVPFPVRRALLVRPGGHPGPRGRAIACRELVHQVRLVVGGLAAPASGRVVRAEVVTPVLMQCASSPTTGDTSVALSVWSMSGCRTTPGQGSAAPGHSARNTRGIGLRAQRPAPSEPSPRAVIGPVYGACRTASGANVGLLAYRPGLEDAAHTGFPRLRAGTLPRALARSLKGQHRSPESTYTSGSRFDGCEGGVPRLTWSRRTTWCSSP